jgi:threonine/homoserine/homoserine lactone efflux protein
MRIFLFILSIVSILLATRQFSLAEQTGQYKGALFLLLIGIQLLIAAALISEYREERTRKSSTSTNREDSKAAGAGAVNESVEEGKAAKPMKE